MARWLLRVATAAVLGAAAGAATLTLLYVARPSVAFEIDRDPPRMVSGLFPPERSGEHTYAWSGPNIAVKLAGIDRRVSWTCTLRLRGARPPGVDRPTITTTVDGVITGTAPVADDYQDVAIVAAPRTGSSTLIAGLVVAPTFRPGGGDPRELGVQVDRIACDPAGTARPPMGSLGAVAEVGFVLGAAIAMAGGSWALATGAALAAAIGMAMLLGTGGAVYGSYAASVSPWVWPVAAAVIGIAQAPRLFRRPPVSTAAVGAIAIAAVACFLKLAGLLHPSKLLIDAVFHAHRLEWVRDGRYFFTQPMPDGVSFPYAIGLYVVASPLVDVVRDHVSLLRVVVVAAEAIATGMLYLLVVRTGARPAAGVIAVLLASVIPLPLAVLGNANLTNSFAQAIALIAVVLAAVVDTRVSRVLGWTALTLTSALALLSHVSTAAVTSCTLAAIGIWTFATGERPTRPYARGVVLAAVAAAVAAFVLYYSHFPEVYRAAWTRMRAQTAEVGSAQPKSADAAPSVDAAPSADATPSANASPSADIAILSRQLAWHERASNTVTQTASDIGWPVLLLAAVGGWHVWRNKSRDRASLALMAWVAVWMAALMFGTGTRVDVQYQRYAAEFIGRINLAGFPAVVSFAGIGAGHAFAAGRSSLRARAWAALCLLLVVVAVWNGAVHWISWLQ